MKVDPVPRRLPPFAAPKPVSEAAASGIQAPGDTHRYDRRYSRFVFLMKVLLPAVAVALVVLVMAWPHIDLKTANRFKLGFSGMIVNEGRGNDVVNPRLVGTDSDNQPFSVTADIAKDVSITGKIDAMWQSPDPVELEMPKADLALKDGTWLVLTAETGTLVPKTKSLDLVGAVNLFHDSGYEFRTEAAHIDLDSGNARGEVPVEGQGPFGNLTAEGFRLADKGKTILFTGKAKVVMYPSAGKAAP